MLEADGFLDLQRFLFVYDCIEWESVPLLHIHRVGLNTMRSLGRVSANDDYIWSKPANSVTFTAKDAHEGRKRGVPATDGPYDWKTVPPTFNSHDNCTSDVRSPDV